MNKLTVFCFFAFWILIIQGSKTATASDGKLDYRLLNRIAVCQSVQNSHSISRLFSMRVDA